MKKIFLVFIFTILASCIHSPCKVNTDNIRGDMAGLNQRLRGHLYNQVMNKDLSSLDEARYLAIAKEQQDPSEKEFFEFLEKQKPEIKLRGSKTDFVVCVKAVRARVVICDKASTGFTDFNSEDTSVDLTVKINSYELK